LQVEFEEAKNIGLHLVVLGEAESKPNDWTKANQMIEQKQSIGLIKTFSM
jgi:hypothetical protein